MKSFKSGETEDIADIDEEVEEGNMLIYLFNNNVSKLEKEKTSTPSPLKSRLLYGSSLVNLADLGFENKA